MANAEDAPPGLFSLPREIIWKIMVEVPRRLHPILSGVNAFRNLVLSEEMQRLRSRLGKESLLISFNNAEDTLESRLWFNFRRIVNSESENEIVPVNTELPSTYPVAVGSEVYFFGGRFSPSSRVDIFDSRSGQLRQGINMLVERIGIRVAGLVGGRLYVVGGGGDGELQAESFDLSMQTWEPAPNLVEEYPYACVSGSLSKKLCGVSTVRSVVSCYNVTDGSCERFNLGNCSSSSQVSVVSNVLYVYYQRLGLMWYDSKLMRWGVVTGLQPLSNVEIVGVGEYYGKLALLWKVLDVSRPMQELRCCMIGLTKTDAGIHGTQEPSQLLRTFPRHFLPCQCLSLSD